jgi:hypothetical protein
MVEAGEASKTLAVLGGLSADQVNGHQPYWVTLANANGALGAKDAMTQARRRAIGPTEDPAVRDFPAQLRTD